ncbi:hypothetical protein [Albidovulum sp.]
MLTEITSALARARATLIGDLAGLVSLVAMLVVGLHLPAVI